MIYVASRPEAYVIIGLSSETKPTNVVPNSAFFEIDTGEWWIWSSGAWWKAGKQPH